jgi:hypothetical protein
MNEWKPMLIAEPTSLSSTDLRRVLSTLFDDEELRILCHELDVNYDDLRGDSRKAKALSLVIFTEERGRLPELEAAVRCERPELDTTYSRQRVQELQKYILAALQADIRKAFAEFNQQIEAYLNEFRFLHQQIEEWKEVHHLLQDLQFNFTPCRGHIYALDELQSSAPSAQSPKEEKERILFRVEVDWKPCQRTLYKLEELAASVQAIGDPYDSGSGTGPDWFCKPKRIAGEIETALFCDDVAALANHLSAFGDQVDRCLYQADKALRDVVGEIRNLPRPGLYAVRSQ